MRDGVFVTGASGFVGRHLLPALLASGRPVYVLDRSGSTGAAPGVTVIKGDLLEPEAYGEALRSCSTVVHLAAATGRATAGTHHRVNARGTQVLLEACRAARVDRFLFVSSIATIFPPGIGYHYADAKRSAEESVVRSGLRYTILRPTVITGPGAPNLRALEKLALLPVIVVPGHGRARVQPVDVTDVAGAIVSIVANDTFANEVREIGGRSVMSMEEQLQKIRQSRTGKRGRVLHVPLVMIRIPLKIAEAAGLIGLLPVTAGQLSSFRFDGVTAEHRPKADAATVIECKVLTRYLLRRDPDSYVVDQYAAALATLELTPEGRFDESLLTFGRVTPLFTRLADSYASLFVRTASLRKRLVLLLAILETRPPFHEEIDRSVSGSTPYLFVRLALTMTAATVAMVAGTLIVPPACAVLALVGRGSR